MWGRKTLFFVMTPQRTALGRNFLQVPRSNSDGHHIICSRLIFTFRTVKSTNCKNKKLVAMNHLYCNDFRVTSTFSQTLCFQKRDLFSYFKKRNDKHEENNPEKFGKLVYKGPHSVPLRGVKVMSIGAACTTIFASPFMVLLGKDSVPIAARVVMAGTLGLVGLSTTLLLNYITRTYVTKMYIDPTETVLALECLSLFARPRHYVFPITDIHPPEGSAPLVTFRVGDIGFYVDKHAMLERGVWNRVFAPRINEYNEEENDEDIVDE